MTSFPSSSTPTRTGEVCRAPPDLRVTSTARWLLATNSRASSGPTRSPLPPSADRSGCCAWWHTPAHQRRRARVSQERSTPPGGESSGRSSSYPPVVCRLCCSCWVAAFPVRQDRHVCRRSQPASAHHRFPTRPATRPRGRGRAGDRGCRAARTPDSGAGSRASLPAPVTRDPAAVTLLAPDGGIWVMGALMALDRLVVATGLLVLLGVTGLLAVARLATPAWRLNQRLERQAWRLLEVAWWVTLLGTLAGLLLYGPFSTGRPPILALDWTLLLDHTVRTRFGNVWALRILLLLLLAVLLVWSKREAERTPRSAWLAVAGSAVGLAVTPALGGHAAAGPTAAVGAVVGVVHFSAAAVWFGGLVLLGTCLLPRADVGLLGAVPRFSSVAFTAMVVIVVTGMVQGWRQVGSLPALGHTAYGRLLVVKVAAFLLLIVVASRSRALVRRKLTARALVGAPDSPGPGAALAGPSDHGSLWLLRRLVLTEVIIAIVVLAVTALLGIATPPGAG